MSTRTAPSTESGRVEAFSDGVFAIAITLLVLDLPVPGSPGVFEGVVRDWPAFLAYLSAFLTLASIWVHHHMLFSRIRRVEPAVILLNLVLLLGVAIQPWPTRVLSQSIADGTREDGIFACALYGGLGLYLIIMWFTMTWVLSSRPHLLVEPTEITWTRGSSFRVVLSAVPLIGAAAVAFVTPILSLVVFTAIPAYFLFWTSRGTTARDSAASEGGRDITEH